MLNPQNNVSHEPLVLRVYDFVVSRERVCLRDVYREFGVNPSRVDECLRRLWERDHVRRTKKAFFVYETAGKGRAGIVGHARAINYYAANDGRELSAEYVRYEDRCKDGRSRDVISKANRILNYLINNNTRAFYSRDIVQELKVKSCDIMSNVRRFERKGLVYVRGYQSHDKRSPFMKGFILTYVDQELPRDKAIKEAFERTNRIIMENPTSNTIHERIRQIRDQLLTANEILSLSYFKHLLNCPIDYVKRAIRRAKQLYPDIKEVRIFDKFTYYYMDSWKPEDLAANIEMKKNYIRVRFGRENRIGHNWEACVEWFIDKFTEGAEFQEQNHRQKMDKRRITLHLLRPVGDRKQAAEVDRVWKVTPGLFSPTVTYVLECKWGLVTKKTLDDLLEVLKWSTDFGVDTENGRDLKKSIVPVFAAGTFNPREQVLVNGERITLTSYAYRLNIKLLRSADFNAKLREQGIEKKATAQKICEASRDEKQVREILNTLWSSPKQTKKELDALLQHNVDVFDFEKKLNV